MIPNWVYWAKNAKQLMLLQGVIDIDAWKALCAVERGGYEPYHTLKGFVCRLESK